jgi:hypothetical protein
MENPARYGEALYAHDGDSLYVNLFVASEVDWPEEGLVLRQRTRFPDEPETRLELRLREPRHLTLKVRHPAWAEGEVELEINGAPVAAKGRPGSWLTLERDWVDGDSVTLRLPMGLRLEAMPDDPRTVALLYGPVVLAADLGPAPADQGKRLGPSAPDVGPGAASEAPVLIAVEPGDVLAHVRKDGQPLSFRTVGLGRPRDVELRPFFRLSDRRYTVYFSVLSEAGWTERKVAEKRAAEHRRAIEARTVDAVQAGDEGAEKGHALEQERSDSGRLEGRPFRSARYGGSFSYELALPPRRGPVALRVTYWGGETRRHEFDVVVEGKKVATQSLFDDRPGELFAVEYPLEEALVAGRERVRAGIRTGPSSSSGAVFDLRLVRALSPAP